MLKLYIQDVDVTAYIMPKTVSIKSQQNNRTNQLQFNINDYRVSENQSVELYDWSFAVTPITSDTVEVYDIYDFQQKFRVGDVVYIDNEKRTIQSISWKTIKLNKAVLTSKPVKTFIGKKIYGWTVVSTKEIERSQTNNYEQQIKCNDYSELFDRQAVVETFDSMFFREILWRIVYEFVATDSSAIVDGFESAWTNGGTGAVMTDDSTDRIAGNYSQNTSMTTGTATRTKTITSTDFSWYADLRYWWKTDGDIDNFNLRIGTDSSNYYEYSNPRVGLNWIDCWHYESFDIDNPVTVGSPDLTNITWIQIELESSVNVSNIRFDEMSITTGGITMKNTQRGTAPFGRKLFKSVKPTRVVEELTKMYDEYWYIDYERDFHYYYKNSKVYTPYEITETSEEYWKLSIKPDTTKLLNRQQVEGKEAPSVILYTQEEVADGEQTSFRLDYKPVWERPKESKDGLRVYVNDVEKTVGIENLDTPADHEFLLNFQEKFVKNSTEPTLTSWDVIKFVYYPYKVISVRYQDADSIDKMKALTGGNWIYDWQIIIDKTLETVQDVRQRAKIEVDTYKNPQINCSFITEKEGIEIGQLTKISDPDRDIDDYFLVQKIRKNYKEWGLWVHSVDCATTLFWYIEFFQMLLRESSKNRVTEENEVVIIPINMDEEFTIDENYTLTKQNDTYILWLVENKWYDFMWNTGTQIGAWRFWKQRYINSWVWEFTTITKDWDWKAIEITSTGWMKLSSRNRYQRSWETYSITARLEVISNTGIITGTLYEYSSKTSDTPTNSIAIFSISNTLDIENYATTYTATDSWYSLEIECSNDAVVQIVDFWKKESNTVWTQECVLGFSTLA